MGRVSAPFGVKGWVKVQPFTDKIDGLLRYPQWWLSDARGWRSWAVEEQTVRGSELLVRFAGVADREAAATLKGSCAPALDLTVSPGRITP